MNDINVFGVGMTPDLRAWDTAQRRVGSLLALGAAALLVLVGLVTFAFAGAAAAAFYWVLVALIVLVLAYTVAVLVFGLRAESAAAPSPTPVASADAPAADDAAFAPPTPRPRVDEETLTLRCGECGTVFDLTDTGQRPLYHECPGCGAEGVLREPAVPTPTPAPAAQWDAPPREPQVPTPTPAPQPAAAPAKAKTVKLRCGGCKQVFALEDTGARPLESRCPHCDRKGIIR